MKIHENLWRRDGAPPSLERLAEKLREFFTSNDWMSLLVKGKWGCGKTAGLLSVLKHIQDEEKSPGSYSVVSLSGLPDLRDERQLLTRGLRYSKERAKNLTRGLGETLSRFSKSITIPSVGAAAPALAKAGGDWLADAMLSKMLDGALIVLDDLERRDAKVTLQEVFGCVTRLTENHQCRVIVVCNTDRLSVDDTKILDEQRDKVFDLEYRFEPSLDENLEILVQNPEHRDLIATALRTLESSNLRVVAKLNAALRAVDQKLGELPPRVIEAARKSLVIQAALRWGAKASKSVSPETFKLACSPMGRIFSDEEGHQIPKELYELTDALHATESPFDIVAWRWLEEGRFDTEEIEQVRHQAQDEDLTQQILSDIEELRARLNSSFTNEPSDVAQRVVEHIQCNSAHVPLAPLFNAFFLLERGQFPFDRGDLERRWVEVATVPSDLERWGLTDTFQDPVARRTWDAKVQRATHWPRSDDRSRFLSFIRSAVGNSQLTKQGPEFCDPDWIYAQLHHSDEENLLPILRKMLEGLLRIRGLKSSGSESHRAEGEQAESIIAAFVKALQSTAQLSTYASRQVEAVLAPLRPKAKQPAAAPPSHPSDA